ncbi:MAG: outer membrane protein assembly factor BamD [Nitrospiraceae bacterium]|nr:outer membrane protein assembly factor BamD [Nitrospiraceae bacterium]
MKKVFVILGLVVLAACAKEPPFDPVAKFREAEDKMVHYKYEDARKAYQEIQEKAPDRSYDADIMLRIADTYYGEEKYGEAQVEYQSFLNFHPVHRDAPYAQFQIGMCSYNDLTTIDRDPGVARTAIIEFRKLLDKYPGSPYETPAKEHIAECRNRLAEYELYVGRFYYKKDSYKSAIGRLEKLVKDYPGSPSEEDALYYTGLSYLELGEKAKALAAFREIKARFPASAHRVDEYLAKLGAS